MATSTPNSSPLPLYELRELEIKFIGIDENTVDKALLTSSFHTTDAPYPAEYPSGEILSNLDFTHIELTFTSQSVLSTFFSQLFLVAQQGGNSTDYFIQYEDFIQALTESAVIPTAQYPLNTYRILVINLAADFSPFGRANVYINFSCEDHDTQQRSLLRPHAPYGISFSLANRPVVGLIVSSEPHFRIDNYPLYQSFVNGTSTNQQWNTYLKDHLKQTIWCRFNPSPVFRYHAHDDVTIRLALIAMDTTYSIIKMKDYLDQVLIQTKVANLLCISEVQVLTLLCNAPLEMRRLSLNSWESSTAWLFQIATYLKENSEFFWDLPYSLSNTEYGSTLDLFVAIIYGNKSVLPYTPENAGITFYASDTSDEGGLALITLNYDQIFTLHEGLTLTTLHEISHLLGLIHPHDYWHPIIQHVESSWLWGYTSSPVTYLCSGYDFDYCDKLLVWRSQMHSLLTSMTEYDYEQNKIKYLYNKIEKGSYFSLDQSLLEAVRIYQNYQHKKAFHKTFTFGLTIILPIMGIILFLGIGWRIRGRKS